MSETTAIGVFDSGYGGLTVLKEIVSSLPNYDFIFLGDNARAPYGSRSFETVYHYTLQCVKWFFEMNCPLVVLACNTASAKALRTIQQQDLTAMDSRKRVLGVIRPTTEVIGNYSQTKSVGILATTGTVQSNSYVIEINKFFPDVQVYQQACPMWVPLVENNEHQSPGADYFVQKYIDALMAKSKSIDTILLACTHYPLLADKIRNFSPPGMQIVGQGPIVADSLVHYLERHPEIDSAISKKGKTSFYTTDEPSDFNSKAELFYGHAVQSNHVQIG